jgi:chromosomal replication initiator protein
MAVKDPKQLWKTTLAQIEIKLDAPSTYKTFFSGTELVRLEDEQAIIGVANGYIHDWLQQKYNTLIQQTLSHVYGKDLKVTYEIVPDYAKGTPQKLERQEKAKPAPAGYYTSTAAPADNSAEEDEWADGGLLSTRGGVHTSVIEALSRSGLNEKYTLSSYVVGQSNRIAHAAAQAIIKDLGKVYNPLFIHGHTGVGKTHLAQAIGRSILERSPHKKVVYVSAEGFMNDMVKAIRTNKNIEFRNRYRSVNLLIIDDIQLISKWVDTQTEFFNAFNELYNNNSHVILISDRPPEEIKNLEDRLKSRFMGGLVVDINQPEFELRLAILEKKAHSAHYSLPGWIIETIARYVEDNVRALEGALQNVAFLYNMKKDGELSLEEVKKIAGADTQTKREKVKVPSVLKEVSKTFNVTVKDLKGTQRTKEIALARQVAMYILREELDYNLQDVAHFLQRSDHTTVMHAVDKVKSLLLTDPQFKQVIVGLVKQLQEQPLED